MAKLTIRGRVLGTHVEPTRNRRGRRSAAPRMYIILRIESPPYRGKIVRLGVGVEQMRRIRTTKRYRFTIEHRSSSERAFINGFGGGVAHPDPYTVTEIRSLFAENEDDLQASHGTQ